jgi:hypothetical protein
LTKALPLGFFGCSVADQDLGLGAFLTLDPGSGIGFSRIPDPKLTFLMTNFGVKSTIILSVLEEKKFLYRFKNKIIYKIL